MRSQHSPGRAEGGGKWCEAGHTAVSLRRPASCPIHPALLTILQQHGLSCSRAQSWPLAAAAEPCVFAAGYFFTGDGAYRSQQGYYQITGRMDDIINISGHRLGTAEIEDAMVGARQAETP